MSRTNKDGLMGSFKHLTIAKRITLLYGGIFSLSLLFISIFMLLNISGLQQAGLRGELQETVANVQEYLESGRELSDQALTEFLNEKYVEVSVFSYGENQTYNNYTGETPPFILRPEERPSMAQEDKAGIDFSAEQSALQENDLHREGYQINVRR